MFGGQLIDTARPEVLPIKKGERALLLTFCILPVRFH